MLGKVHVEWFNFMSEICQNILLDTLLLENNFAGVCIINVYIRHVQRTDVWWSDMNIDFLNFWHFHKGCNPQGELKVNYSDLSNLKSISKSKVIKITVLMKAHF
jgi:hypothetical protein